jgi:type II secretory pathway pseudopilin PulG
MKSSTFIAQHSKVRLLRVRPSSPGFTYIGLLAVIVIIGISLGAAGKYWSNVMLRDKEEELLFRGDQYRRAIEQYYSESPPGRAQYPPSIDKLLTDDRSPSGKRHLRQQYKDPITGEDFEILRALQTNQIVGVVSKSNKEPLKKNNFEDSLKDFADKKKYSEWVFIARARPGQTPLTIVLPVSSQTSTDLQLGDTGQTPAVGQTSGSTIVQPIDASLPPIPGTIPGVGRTGRVLPQHYNKLVK